MCFQSFSERETSETYGCLTHRNCCHLTVNHVCAVTILCQISPAPWKICVRDWKSKFARSILNILFDSIIAPSICKYCPVFVLSQLYINRLVSNRHLFVDKFSFEKPNLGSSVTLRPNPKNVWTIQTIHVWRRTVLLTTVLYGNIQCANKLEYFSLICHF